MQERATPAPEIKLYALVRDAQGRPKVDDPQSMPPEVVATLSPEDRAYLGLAEEN